jgi:hypothetical protein
MDASLAHLERGGGLEALEAAASAALAARMASNASGGVVAVVLIWSHHSEDVPFRFWSLFPLASEFTSASIEARLKSSLN